MQFDLVFSALPLASIMPVFDPAFYLIAFVAVFINGLSKGGFGGGIGMISTPMLALVMPPVQAAAVMLPVLIVMDMIGLYNYRSRVDWQIIRAMVPFGLIGILIGWLTAARVSDDWTRIMVGFIAVIFAVNQFAKDYYRRNPSSRNSLKAAFWGCCSGFTSFISHAGGPPFQAYVLPLKLDKMLFAGTGVLFFAIINLAKLPPYFALGQFPEANLKLSLLMVPPAISGVLLGVWAVRRVTEKFFYNFSYVAMIAIGAKLIWDGRSALGIMG
jgi:uncharacterized membrane protein YfcA